PLCLRKLGWPVQPWQRAVIRPGAATWRLHRDERSVLSLGPRTKEHADRHVRVLRPWALVPGLDQQPRTKDRGLVFSPSPLVRARRRNRARLEARGRPDD